MRRGLYRLLRDIFNPPEYMSHLDGSYASMNDYASMTHYAGLIRVRRRRLRWCMYIETAHVIDMSTMMDLPCRDVFVGDEMSVLKRMSLIRLYENEMDYRARSWEYRLYEDVSSRYDMALVSVERGASHGESSDEHGSVRKTDR